jgi:hypothetical protein
MITARLHDTRLIHKSQLLSYIPTMNKWNLKLKCTIHISTRGSEIINKSNKICTRAV